MPKIKGQRPLRELQPESDEFQNKPESPHPSPRMILPKLYDVDEFQCKESPHASPRMIPSEAHDIDEFQSKKESPRPSCSMDTQVVELQDIDMFQSTPTPPPDLWDTDDEVYLNKVRCWAKVRLTSVNPKAGTFGLHMKCHWRFRTLNSQDRNETHLRVPGLRAPGVTVKVIESSVWRDANMSTDKTLLWRGVSLFIIAGFEIFHMSDFPFDRQAIDLELLEFVWKDSKDEATYASSMHLVYFLVTTESRLPDWDPFPASTSVEQIMVARDYVAGPTFASRFRVKLRIERKVRFYLIQVLFVTQLITIFTILPLALPPTEMHQNTRYTIYTMGILTLVAFKYSMGEMLPKVHYQTFTDRYLICQIVTLVAFAIESLLAFHLVTFAGANEASVGYYEDCVLGVTVCVWIAVFIYTAKFKERMPWDTVCAINTRKKDSDPN